jgi:hypothetical protein
VHIELTISTTSKVPDPLVSLLSPDQAGEQ